MQIQIQVQIQIQKHMLSLGPRCSQSQHFNGVLDLDLGYSYPTCYCSPQIQLNHRCCIYFIRLVENYSFRDFYTYSVYNILYTCQANSTSKAYQKFSLQRLFKQQKGIWVNYIQNFIDHSVQKIYIQIVAQEI